jgi:predicted nucleic acid-binding protein
MNECRSLIKALASELSKGTVALIESSDFSHLADRYPMLGVGELSVIASAGGGIAFIEDRKAEGVPVFNIPELLLVCKKKGLIGKFDLVQILDELKKKDVFTQKGRSV